MNESVFPSAIAKNFPREIPMRKPLYLRPSLTILALFLEYIDNFCTPINVNRYVDEVTGRVNVIVILKNLEETARLCQRRKLNGYFLVFDLHHDNHNAIFFLENEGKIVINYDPNYMQRSKF